jgi:hypothetical protein
MKEKFLKFNKKIKDWLTQVLFKKFLTPIALVLIYTFVVGFTSIIAKIFFRKFLEKKSLSDNSNWLSVENNDELIEDSLKQS